MPPLTSYMQQESGVSKAFSQNLPNVIHAVNFVNSENPFFHDQPVSSYMPLNRPLYTKVSPKLREKIISNQYNDNQEILDEPSYKEDDI